MVGLDYKYSRQKCKSDGLVWKHNLSQKQKTVICTINFSLMSDVLHLLDKT